MVINPQSLVADEKFLFHLASRNEVLSELFSTPAARNELLSEPKIVSLDVNQVLYEQGDKIDVIYFPIDSVVSGLAIMEDGATVETSMIGGEGICGISTILGSGISRHWSWVLVSGNAIQLDAKLLERLVVSNESALKALLKCYRSLIAQVTQRCVCNTRHTILERLCCWLLMLHDRVGDENLRLTQEMIASRLGARRAGITVAAGLLQTMHAIEYRRGQMHIRDRLILEHAACECYDVLRIDAKYSSPPQELFRPFAINE